MKKLLIILATVSLFGCGEFIQVENFEKEKNQPAPTQPINISVLVEGSSNVVNGGSNIANGGAGGTSSNTNHISSGNNSATGGSGNGGNGGSSSAGNSTANNSSSSNSTNNSTNSGSASNQANNSNSNSNSSQSSISDSGNSSNSVEVNQQLDYRFNIFLGFLEDYFELAHYDNTPRPRECRDPQPNLNLLCHVYDFAGRTSLTNQLDNAPHLGSFYMDKFDVTARSWDQGFPKLPTSLAHLREYYAVRCFAKLDVKAAGQHTFSITSDDGMRVILNGAPILEDDSLHSPRTKSGNVNLVKGLYEMEVQWFQGPRTQIAAELKWSTPGNSSLRYIEPSDMVKTKRLCE